MKLSQVKPLLYTAIASGIILGLTLVFGFHTDSLLPTWEEIILFFLSQLAATIAIGCVAGAVLKKTIHNSYLVSIFTLLYLYDTAELLSFTRSFGYVGFVLLLALISTGLFAAMNKLFKKYTLHKKQLIIVILVGWLSLWLLCKAAGLFLIRLIALSLIY